MRPKSTARVSADDVTNAMQGTVLWNPFKSLWVSTMSLVAIVAGPTTFSWDALALFLCTTVVTICFGHSIGMHRLLIHRSFACSLWLEQVLVYLGTLVGMAGPFGMMRTHDIRDWAQRQSSCHEFHAHRMPFFHDAWWQMHSELRLSHPPAFSIEPFVRDNKFYQFIERTWMAQQLPWAILFWWIGGWSWVVWGIAVRIAISLTGHWLVGHFAHRSGRQDWHINEAAVQGFNVPYCGLITMGEAWHNNHHAFPDSARLGHKPLQLDPGWWVIVVLRQFGWVWNVKTPETLGHGADVLPVCGVHNNNGS